MVKPATGPDHDVDTLKALTGDSDVTSDDLGDKKPSPYSGHSDDPDFYVDQYNLIRWRVLGAAGEVITSATEGFPTEKEAEANFEECRKDGRLVDFIEFQGKSGKGFSTTETTGPAKKAAKKT